MNGGRKGEGGRNEDPSGLAHSFCGTMSGELGFNLVRTVNCARLKRAYESGAKK